MTCPHCSADRAHRSHRSGLKDRFMRIFQMIPYRCRACQRRFYAYRAGETSDRMRTREEQKIMRLRRRLKWKKSKVQLLAYSIGFIVFLSILYMVVQQRLPAQ